MFTLTSPLAGAAQFTFTSPTYTLSADTPPVPNAKQYAVTALGGTQAGVLSHNPSAPFTIAMFRPATYKSLEPVDPVTGVLRRVPVNTYKVITRKGVTPLAGQAPRTMIVTTTIEVPAGSDVADQANVRACLSAHFGVFGQQSSEIGGTVINGVL